ncbi:LPS export ABC transporter permease LptG [Candidatus Blochmannia ocreatus (nom. nud.)]|uniref:LPS export ABC transporter permease LptG n=1 Tax=Candidatus Blochmannia ocreatus (nom. nud.) TaxID=251538 RepID=A0ABY4SXY0_9ENTR|nr:LPS export ABC transporter permease LptG [Candidatus Blochmannia ocreatus]URJ25128.1 LPS export ABC transporter permease LptG [Candidatus Blochmannia ocreatus]
MCGILNKYIRAILFSSITVVFLILISLSSIIRLVDELRKIEIENYSIFEVVIFIILSVPKDFILFFPIAVLLGGLIGLSIFETHNEFIAIQLFGYSKFQIFISAIKAAMPILLCSLIFNEWLMPNSEKMIYKYRDHSQNNFYLVSEKIKNFWFRDKDNFVHVECVTTYEELLGVTLYNFNKKQKLNKIFYAKRAIFINKVWNLLDVTELCISENMHTINNSKFSCVEWNIQLNPKILSMITVRPNILSISNLYNCIKYFNQNRQNSRHYQIIFWNKILSPISGIVMMFTALTCTFGPLYQKKMGFKLFIGSIIGFLFYILNQIFSVSSAAHNISPVFSALIPSIVFLLLSIMIIRIYS